MWRKGLLLLSAVALAVSLSLIWRASSVGSRSASPSSPVASAVKPDAASIDERVPPDCNPNAGAGGARIDTPGTIPPVVEGQLVNYRLRVDYLADASEVLCQAFNVDVWIRLPGETIWQLVCTHPVVNEGDALFCPSTVPYTADGADRTAGVLQAFMFAIGDRHTGPDCITTPDDPNTPPVGPVCFGALLTNSLVMPNTPTPTATSTSTPTATATPEPPNSCARADVTHDGKVTVADVVAVAKRTGARHAYDAQFDVNADGKVSARDLNVVLDCRRQAQ